MKKKFMKTLAAALVLSVLFSMASFAGWDKQTSGWVYLLDDGTAATNTWITDEDGQSYYLGSNGIMETNTWVPSNDKWYYVGSDGAVLRGIMLGQNNNTTWYLLGEDGAMLTNLWYQEPEKGDWYYFGSDGIAYKGGWYNIDGEEYYFLNNSKMARSTIEGMNALVPGGGSVDSDGRRVK